jgi:nucleoside-diphosphate-sugar epimerase
MWTSSGEYTDISPERGTGVIREKKILVTGAAGNIGLPLVEHLATDNTVWAVARYSDSTARDRVAASGAVTHVMDMASGDFAGLPDDFDYVVHLVTSGSRDSDVAVRVDGEGTALLLDHCRRARAALVMSSGSVYRRAGDPQHHYCETDPLGEGLVPSLPAYSLSKHVQEAAARSAARLYDLPVIIARMGTAYGGNGGLPAWHLDAIMAGQQVPVGNVDAKFVPIHEDDIRDQLEKLLDAATVPATVVNWGGDEIASPREWTQYLGELTGKDVRFDETVGYPGCIFDVTKRQSITGPCRVSWREGMARVLDARYPGARQTSAQ